MYSRVYLEITNICNLACPFCHKTKRKKAQMTFDEFSGVISKLTGITEYLYFHLMGEPLTHPLLAEFVKYAASQGFHPAITTNGTLLPDVGDSLLGIGLYKISISLHCTEGGNADYIRSCLDFADKSSEEGILTILRLWNGEDRASVGNAAVLKMIKERFPEGEFAEGSRGIRIKDRLHLEYGERFDWPDTSLSDMGENVFCYGLRDHFGILVDGSVVPCCLDAEGDAVLGNAFKDDISDILSSELATAIKTGFDNKKAVTELCRRCGYARRFKL